MKPHRFLLVLLLAATSLPAAADPFRFIQISDTHQGRPIHQYRYRQAIRQINELPFEVEVVAHTGDLVSFGLKSHEVAGAASNLFSQIRWPKISCPGNHDFRFDRINDAWTNRYYRAVGVYRAFFGPLGQAHETENALYVAIDTEEIRQIGAPRLPDFDPLVWLEETLSAAPPDKPVFVFTHVPDCDDSERQGRHRGPLPPQRPCRTSRRRPAHHRGLQHRQLLAEAGILPHFHLRKRMSLLSGRLP